MVGSGYPDAQILLGSTLSFNFSTTFCFSISSSISLLMSPVLKSPLLPWSQSFCHVLQTFRYGYLCLFLLCSFSHLNCPLRYSHSAFLLKQDPRLQVGCALIDLSGEFSLRLAFIFHEALASLGIPSPSSLSMESMCKPLCSQQIHGQRKACRTGNW